MRELERRSRSLSAAVDSARVRFFSRLRAVDVQLDSLFAQGASRQGYINAYDEREARFTSSLEAADTLRAAINVAADERRGAITSTEDVDAMLTGALTLLGLAAAVAAARLATGMRSAVLAAETRRAEVERVTESRARLIRGFTHDVRNPLGAADGHLALLEDGIRGDLAPPQHDSVVKARRSIRVAIDLIAQLLELARAEAGHLAQRSEPFDFRDVVSEVADEFMASAEAKHLTMSISLSTDLPTATSDAGRVRQIVANIVSNAVKYTPDGGRVEIRTFMAEHPKAVGPGTWIAVEVADTGRGITAEQLKVVFQEFTRFDPAAAQGSGIGLAISDRIARSLGGRITVDSVVGQGSRFTFWLPVRPERRAA
jgi:signal transduction histidine kinase